MIIDIVSDLHGSYPKLEGGDLLILGGDYTARDTLGEYLLLSHWVRKQKYKKIIMIGGNHDMRISHGGRYFLDHVEAAWLEDSGCEWEGLEFWGSPWTAWFKGINPRCKAWVLQNEKELAKKWKLIPEGIDILITHSPPYGILDEVIHDGVSEHVGSKSLLDVSLWIQPKVHIFGHIHEGYGQFKTENTLFINASHMDVNYIPVNKPVRIEL